MELHSFIISEYLRGPQLPGTYYTCEMDLRSQSDIPASCELSKEVSASSRSILHFQGLRRGINTAYRNRKPLAPYIYVQLLKVIGGRSNRPPGDRWLPGPTVMQAVTRPKFWLGRSFCRK